MWNENLGNLENAENTIWFLLGSGVRIAHVSSHQHENAEKDTQKTAKDLLRRLHVKSDDKVYSGAKAFIILWNSMPKFKLLGKILSLLILYQLFSLSYEVVAFFLYLKNRKQLKN